MLHSFESKRAMRSSPHFVKVIPAIFLLVVGWCSTSLGQSVDSPIIGEIQKITINTPGDPWSGGIIVVGGQNVTIPRNLLIDLPANRLTLKQLFDQAPTECVALGQTGLARSDTCITNGRVGNATIAATRTAGGNVIAGDIFIQKGLETVTGQITFINYIQGFFRVNGTPGNGNNGVMVRINDPTGRHTSQRGLGCRAGSPNCSADPRFTLDPDNYTNTFTTGYPVCIPSAVPRRFTEPAGFDVNKNGTPSEPLTAVASAAGTGDLLCPDTNRSINGGLPVDESRLFAPILVGDSISAEGNFEVINGVELFSAHTTMVSKALTTKPDADQPDYMFLEEVFIDGPGFQNQRVRSLFIGFATLAPVDVVIWSIHRDPILNQVHEFPLASVVGCDLAAGAGTCGSQGVGGGLGNNIFRIRYDVDFLLTPNPTADGKLSPCAHLRHDPRFSALNICPSALPDGRSSLAEEFGILSPIPHEIQARTGKKIANPELITLDIKGSRATNGQYLFPFGIGLGGIDIPNFFEVNIDRVKTPTLFSGMPWNLDRRLCPGGCDPVAGCEATPQPLDPFPFEGLALDPRIQASTPTGTYNDSNFTASGLSPANDRILSYVTEVSPGVFNFDGNNTVLAWPPIDPAAKPVPRTSSATLICAVPPSNTAPVAVADTARTNQSVSTVINVLANDTDAQGNINAASVKIVAGSGPANGSVAVDPTGAVTYAPNIGFVGTDSFSYTLADTTGAVSNAATVTVSVTDEVITITTAIFQTAAKRWTIIGHTNVPSTPLNTMRIHLNVGTGPAVGSAPVDKFGDWSYLHINPLRVPTPGSSIVVISTNGGTVTAPVDIQP